jgi:flavin reductase
MVSKDDYRNAMARLTGAVNIISSDGEAGLAGFTASAVCSVTDDPPTLLLCVNLSSRQNDLLRTNGVLCVNTLTAGQEPIARAFSNHDLTMQQRFDMAEWSVLESGAPVMKDALAAFDCRVVERLEHGTHAVLFCQVLAAQSGHGDALVYFNRAFRALPGG